MNEFEEAIRYAKTEADLYSIRMQINDAFLKNKLTERERSRLWGLLRTRSEKLQGISKRIY